MFSTGPGIGSKPVCEYFSWCLACATQDLLEEPFSSSFVPFGLKQDVQYLTLLVYCTPQALALALALALTVDLQIDLIQMPDFTYASTLASDLLGLLATKLLTPGSNTFIGDHNAPLGQHEFHIPKTHGTTTVQQTSADGRELT